MADNKNFFGRLFGGGGQKKSKKMKTAVTWSGYEPTFTAFGDDMLVSELVLEAIRLKADFISKLDPRHIRTEAATQTRIDDSSIARVLREPNPYMILSDFLYKAAFLREVNENAFIYLDYYWTKGGYKYYTGAYIIQPSRWCYYEDEQTGELFIGFKFEGRADEVIFKYSEIIHWRKHYEDDTYDGGGKYSRNESRDVLDTLQAYRTICESIAEAAKCACYFDGILKVNAYGEEDEKVRKIRDAFVEDLRTNKKGVAVLDNGAEWENVQRSLKMVDEKTISHFEKRIVRVTGVSLPMLAGDFTTAQKEAFYERCIESGVISLGQAFTKAAFTKWQKSHGDEIIFYPNKIELMSTTEKISLLGATNAMGVWSVNEVREMFGKPPVEGGDARPRGYNSIDEGKPAESEKPPQNEKNEGTEGGADNEQTE